MATGKQKPTDTEWQADFLGIPEKLDSRAANTKPFGKFLHAMSAAMNILIVEDDPGISDVLEFTLRQAGFSTMSVRLGREALERAEQADFIVLDVGLPDLDGFEVCRQIRQHRETPLLFLTSRSEEVDRVMGLEIGGDDYLVKPFSNRELVARVRAILRRLQTKAQSSNAQLQLGALVIFPDERMAVLNETPLNLTRTEFDILEYLASQPNRVFSREQILDAVWSDGGCVTDRAVDAHVKSLRKKLGVADCLETVRGVGYRARLMS